MLSKKFNEAGISFTSGANRDMDYEEDEEEDGGGRGGRCPKENITKLSVQETYFDVPKHSYSYLCASRYRNTRRKSVQKRNRMFEIVQRDMRQKEARLKQRKVAIFSAVGRAAGDDELYVDRDRAAGVTYGKR